MEQWCRVTEGTARHHAMECGLGTGMLAHTGQRYPDSVGRLGVFS